VTRLLRTAGITTVERIGRKKKRKTKDRQTDRQAERKKASKQERKKARKKESKKERKKARKRERKKERVPRPHFVAFEPFRVTRSFVSDSHRNGMTMKAWEKPYRNQAKVRLQSVTQ